jgi:hypothetical protein
MDFVETVAYSGVFTEMTINNSSYNSRRDLVFGEYHDRVLSVDIVAS